MGQPLSSVRLHGGRDLWTLPAEFFRSLDLRFKTVAAFVADACENHKSFTYRLNDFVKSSAVVCTTLTSSRLAAS